MVDVAVVLPFVGISDLGLEGGDLGHGLFFGIVTHPRPAQNVVAHGRKQIAHHLLHAGLGLGRKIFLHILSPERFAE